MASVRLPWHLNGLMNGVEKFIKNSPIKWAWFNAISAKIEQRDNRNLRFLCPTRWVMYLATVEAFQMYYASILELLEVKKLMFLDQPTTSCKTLRNF